MAMKTTMKHPMAMKTTMKHPYAATEHRVIDSPAYADLTFSARSLLVLITRQLTKENNGHLQATFSYMGRFGFSVNTLSRATHELIAHGFIYKTKSGGFHQGAAKFCVTWLTVKNTHGIFMAGFNPCAWRGWIPPEKKSRPPKVMAHSIKNGELTTPAHPKSEAIPPPKSEHNEYVPIGGVVSEHQARREAQRGQRVPFASPLAIKQLTTADRGQSRPQAIETSASSQGGQGKSLALHT